MQSSFLFQPPRLQVPGGSIQDVRAAEDDVRVECPQLRRPHHQHLPAASPPHCRSSLSRFRKNRLGDPQKESSQHHRRPRGSFTLATSQLGQDKLADPK